MKNLAVQANSLFNEYCQICFDEENELHINGDVDSGKYEYLKQEWIDKTLLFLQKLVNKKETENETQD
jgi:hypothetical protein